MNIKYYLDKPNSTEETALYLFIRQGAGGKDKIKYKTGIRLKPTQWDGTTQQVKRGVSGHSENNTFLGHLKSEIQKNIQQLQMDFEQVTFEDIRKVVEALLEGKKPVDTQKEFWQVWNEFIAIKTAQIRLNSVKKYKSTGQHLKDFEKKKRFPLSFERISHSFYEHFTAYLIQEHKHTVNTVSKYFTVIKTFMHWGAERGYHKEQQFRKFKTPTQEADVVALSQDELKKLMKLDLSKKKKLDKVRDTFLFGCFTGQRYSDVANLKRQHIKGKTWNLHTVKTNDSLKIPLTDYALAILEKYKEEEKVLPIMTNQKTNEYLKELGKLAEINEPITITRYTGAKRTDTTVEKHQLLTTHTARRTFVTLSLEKGMRPELVMEVTGHKDYATFRKYIKLTSKNTDIEVRKAWELV